MRVAFLGLGIMGRPMAANLVKAGHEVSVWSRTAGKGVDGARSAASPADAAQGAEVVWMCVSDTNAVESVLFGPNGVEESLVEGMTIVDSSTISPSATRKFAERVAQADLPRPNGLDLRPEQHDARLERVIDRELMARPPIERNRLLFRHQSLHPSLVRVRAVVRWRVRVR